ncbi:metal-dependent hydrolase [Vibrio alfacsensis]|uniref:metal-dependent hydrolase n=1 Tax=Vibrio alfacsensis TaxID=1074311 RepID=UPI002ADD9BB0|nr:metal-dependent hydrolase [Vibrio alfacsensis]WQE78354.1 metal-dependent hydrolase [Vibrio alfacsensis]
MDPITQGLVGATLPQAAGKKQHLMVAGVLGLLAGMAPDLDVFIRSSTDPLFFLEFHRQFSHSLFFIPIGSLICALALHLLFAKKRGLSFKQTWFYCALGYSTHGLLDACTSYGTQLFWPLNDVRYAWNTVSVVDPAFSLPILVLIIGGTLMRNPWLPRVALMWALFYLMLGASQRDKAESAGWQLAKARQHSPVRLEAKPTFGNILVWKVIYETPENYYVDAVRVGAAIKTYSGDTIPKLAVGRDFPWLDPTSQQAKDIERFRHFSNDYLAQDPNHKLSIIDVRYSMIPNRIDALWSIQLSPNVTEDTHVKYATHRDNCAESRQIFIDMIFDSD